MTVNPDAPSVLRGIAAQLEDERRAAARLATCYVTFKDELWEIVKCGEAAKRIDMAHKLLFKLDKFLSTGEI